jgi:uncharacterized metal-binding protein YceD (DUF177 family)
MTPELHRPLNTARIGTEETAVTVVATPAECVALANRMQLPAVLALAVEFRMRREGRSVIARGHLRARVTQTCIISAEDFDADVEERFRVRFVPAGTESNDDDPESDDEIPYEGEMIDLGEEAAEQLALALDPYPRMPGAALPEAEAETETNPFAALRRT